MTAEDAAIAPTCRNHPGVETRVRCSSCGAPICPRCMVATPVGQKCPDCARQPGRARGTPQAALLATVFGASLAAGVAGALVLTLTGFPFMFIMGVLYGIAVGTVARQAARGRAHPLIGVAAVAALVAALAGVVLVLGGNPVAPRVVVAAAIAGVVTWLRVTRVW